LGKPTDLAKQVCYLLFKQGNIWLTLSDLFFPDFTLIDPQIRAGKGVKFSDVAGMKVNHDKLIFCVF